MSLEKFGDVQGYDAGGNFAMLGGKGKKRAVPKHGRKAMRGGDFTLFQKDVKALFEILKQDVTDENVIVAANAFKAALVSANQDGSYPMGGKAKKHGGLFGFDDEEEEEQEQKQQQQEQEKQDGGKKAKGKASKAKKHGGYFEDEYEQQQELQQQGGYFDDFEKELMGGAKKKKAVKGKGKKHGGNYEGEQQQQQQDVLGKEMQMGGKKPKAKGKGKKHGGDALAALQDLTAKLNAIM